MRALIITLLPCMLSAGPALADSCNERDASFANPDLDFLIRLNTQCLKDRRDAPSQEKSYIDRGSLYERKGDY
ncbi:MAG: hypothetical protein WAW96_02060, partial [Alphaproteobacteria bacterium]